MPFHVFSPADAPDGNSLALHVFVFDTHLMVEDPINGMDHSTNDNCVVVFMPDAIKKYANTVIDKPIKKIDNITDGEFVNLMVVDNQGGKSYE